MKFFLRKCLKWFLFLLFTFIFFSLPIYLQQEQHTGDIKQTWVSSGQSGDHSVSASRIDFVAGSVRDTVHGDSTSVWVSARSDSSIKYVYIYVNGEKQDMAMVPDSGRIEFPRVHLKEGANEIAAVLQNPDGTVLAVRKVNIFSIKKT